jgi:hypothetical protein
VSHEEDGYKCLGLPSFHLKQKCSGQADDKACSSVLQSHRTMVMEAIKQAILPVAIQWVVMVWNQ